ncbi:MAG: hypothetical protein Q8861_02660 [Bacteroidota bacterium]|nr:hypothetical protein [Bacteroidota bacterium]
MIYAITYSDEAFISSRKYNIKTSYSKGNVDKAIQYTPSDIDQSFKSKNASIFSYKRGAGLWLWKPYLIAKTLTQLNDGDYLIYTDAGSFYTNKVQYLIDIMNTDKTDIMTFEIPLLQRQFTKKETFVLMNYDKYNFNQILAGYILIRKNNWTTAFIDEWLAYMCDERIVSPKHFLSDIEEFPDFVSHREDQSVFSVLCRKKGIIPYRDPSQYGDYPWEYASDQWEYRPMHYKNSPFPRIIVGNRKEDPIKYKYKQIIKDVCYQLGILSRKKYLRKYGLISDNIGQEP